MNVILFSIVLSLLIGLYSVLEKKWNLFTVAAVLGFVSVLTFAYRFLGGG